MATGGPISFAAIAQKEQKKAPLRTVQLEGQVVLKIAKHCRENAGPAGSSLVTGQLLGLDVGQNLEVTDCFPFPVSLWGLGPPSGRQPATSRPLFCLVFLSLTFYLLISAYPNIYNLQGNVAEEEVDASGDGEGYQLDMLRCLREINVDNNMVGWYQSVSGAYQVVEIIDTFVNYLENLERCICIVYDVSTAQVRGTEHRPTATGAVGLCAIRLSDGFVEAYREGSLTVEKIRAKGLSWHDIFTEIPLTIHNSALAAAMMAQISPPTAISQMDLDRMTLTAAPVMEHNLECLNECLDELGAEQNKLSRYANDMRKHYQNIQQWTLKRKAENVARRAAGEEPLPEEPSEGDVQSKRPAEPNQLENMLLSNQMSSFCDQISAVAAQTLEKLSLLEDLHRL
jgi:translation initiation factor 3 subunit H